MPPILNAISGFVGLLLGALGFFGSGLALARFFVDNFETAAWQAKIALVLGFFGSVIALTDYTTAGSGGEFASGAGAAYFVNLHPVNLGVPASKK